MKYSTAIAQQFQNPDVISLDSEQLAKKIGSQLGEVESTERFAQKYTLITVVRVVSVEEHPNADRLRVCRVDDNGTVENVDRGDDGLVQIVCGAPNVRAGITAVWIPPGATVPSSLDNSEPFVLDARELRGVTSNGMLASAKELGLGDDHDGILEIDVETGAGVNFSELYGLNDVVFDIENKMFTHRPDCFGVLGIAREVAGISGQAFRSPDWYLNEPIFDESGRLAINVSIETERTQRIVAVAMDNITIHSSPLWLRSALHRVGIKPINNVVDATNWVMYITGQPLHAYDYEKVKLRSDHDAKLIARLPMDGESVRLLNGKTITFRDSDTHQDIVIATDKEIIGLAGVMGGADTEVDESTTSIILETASFDMYSIRRTSMQRGLFTDAVTRFSKGQSSKQNARVTKYACDLLAELANAQIASPVTDEYGELPETGTVEVGVDFINQRLGSSLSADEIATMLGNVEFGCSVKGSELTLTVPFWRTDIDIAEDIVEEVGRLYGYDALPLHLPVRSINPTKRNAALANKSRLRTTLARLGANEVLTYSFVHEKVLTKAAQHTENAFQISNALSPDLQYFRLTVTPSLLDKVHMNIKSGYDEFALFEIGKGHNLMHADDDDGLPSEFPMLAFVYAEKKPAGVTFYKARNYLQELLGEYGVNMVLKPADSDMDWPVTQPFDLSRSALVSTDDGTFIGIIGEYKEEVAAAFKLPAGAAGFEVDSSAFETLKRSQNYQPLSRYPSVTQDMTLKASVSISHQKLLATIENSIDVQTSGMNASIQTISIYRQDDESDDVSTTFRITFTHYDKTLSDVEVTEIIKKAASAAFDELGAQLV